MPPRRRRRGLSTEQHLAILHGETPGRGYSIDDALDAILERRAVQKRDPIHIDPRLSDVGQGHRTPMGGTQATHAFAKPAQQPSDFRLDLGLPLPAVGANTRSQRVTPQTLPQKISNDRHGNAQAELRAMLQDAAVEIGHRIVNPIYDAKQTVTQDIPRDMREGNVGSQALNLAGLLPIVGMGAKARGALRAAKEVGEAGVVGRIGEHSVDDIAGMLSDAIYNPKEFIPPGWTPERVARWQMGGLAAANPEIGKLMQRLQEAGITPSPGAIAALKHDHRIREFEQFKQPETYGKVIEELKGGASRNPFETVMLPQGKGLHELNDLELQVLEKKIASAEQRFNAMKGKPDAAGNMRAADYDRILLEHEKARRGVTPPERTGTLRTGEPPKGGRQPVDFVREHASSYMKGAGITDTPIERVTANDAHFHGRVAKAYEAGKNAPNDPKVKAAYAKFVDETEAQYKHIQDQGITIEPVQSDPYKSSAEMMEDVRTNKRLKVFAGSLEHPLLSPEENLHFRAVHDYFAHAGEGNQFGPIGEENAFRAHARMYSAEARKALATETRGQNSWVNFSEANQGKGPKERAFAEQKAMLLPDEYHATGYPKARGEPFTGNEIGKALSILGKTDRELLEHRQQLQGQLTKIADRSHPTAQSLQSDMDVMDEEIRMRGGLRGTEEEMAPPTTLPHEDELLASNRLERQRAKQAGKKLPSVDKLVSASLAGLKRRGWYTNSAQALTEVFGPDAPRFAALLAATSPRTTVEENLKIALKTWAAWTKAGRPTEVEGAKNALKRLVDMEGRVPNALRALTTPNPADIVLSGPKVDSFYQNLVGNTQRVTLDTWMAQLANMDQANLTSGGGPSGKYVAYSQRVRETANELAKRTGHPWTPAEVQSALWSWTKSVGESKDLQQGGLFGGYELTQPMGLGNVPDFDRLLQSPRYKTFLDQLGLQPPTRLPAPPAMNVPEGAIKEADLQALRANMLRSKAGKYALGFSLPLLAGAAQQNAAPEDPERRGVMAF